MTGKLFAIEGIDGAGTTTQARMLGEWMNTSGLPAHVTCEPSNGPVGQLLRQILRHEIQQMDAAAIALLFAADRLHHLRAEISPNIQRGRHVVTDRYVYSSLAYQSVELDREWVASINSRAFEPDLTIYLRVTPELARERRDSRGSAVELFETQSLQERIFAIYDGIFGSTAKDGTWIPDPATDPAGSRWIQKDPDGSSADPAGSISAQDAIGRRPRWAVVDGSLAVDQIHFQIRDLVKMITTLRTKD